MLYFKKHPEGPELPEDTKGRKFRSYVDAANWADNHTFLPGKYWLRNDRGANIWTSVREVTYNVGFKHFYVEGRGNV